MAAVEHAPNQNFYTFLAAPGRSAEIPESADVYGWLVGSWDLDVICYKGVNLSARNIKAEAHFGWVLEGRSIQDVWIMPRYSDRGPTMDMNNNMYGTTTRTWDPTIQSWRIRWNNPVSGHREDQIGRRIGNDVVQIGARPDGTATRWRFTEITPDSFHWTGEALEPDGKTWRLEGEFLARRVG